MLLSFGAFLGEVIEILVALGEMLRGLGDDLDIQPWMLLLDVGLAIVDQRRGVVAVSALVRSHSCQMEM